MSEAPREPRPADAAAPAPPALAAPSPNPPSEPPPPSEPAPTADSAEPPACESDAAEPIIRLEGLHKSFGKTVVLRGIHLAFHPGCTTVIIGPSGTGKSVLLKHIAGLLKPDRGEVWFKDRRVDQLSSRDLVQVRKQVGFLFQMGALFDSMTVEDNVCFPLVEHTSMRKADRQARCRQVLAMVGLDGTQHRMPEDLSGGQKKRVALARAIVMEPSVILYDEPTTGLDPIRADVISELILRLQKHLKITSIVVTHDMMLARKIADRIVMLYDGRILAEGDPQQLERTENDLVQRFVRGEAEKEDLEGIRRGFEALDRH